MKTTDLFPDIINKENSILGIGADICNVTRVKQIYDRFQNKFLTRIFSSQECLSFEQLIHRERINFLAKRFATKEAIAKALKTGIGHQAYFKEITCLKNNFHAPNVYLEGKTHQTALSLAHKNNYDTYEIHISLSDDTEYALAFTIITGKQS